MLKKSLLILTLAGALTVAQSAFALTVYDPTNHTENLATKLQMIEQVKPVRAAIKFELYSGNNTGFKQAA